MARARGKGDDLFPTTVPRNWRVRHGRGGPGPRAPGRAAPEVGGEEQKSRPAFIPAAGGRREGRKREREPDARRAQPPGASERGLGPTRWAERGRALRHLLPPPGRAERGPEREAPGNDAGQRRASPGPGRAGGQRPSGALRPRRNPAPARPPAPPGPTAHTNAPAPRGPELRAGRGPDLGRGTPAGAGGSLAALGSDRGSLPRGGSCARRGRRRHSPARWPLHAAAPVPHSGPNPPSTSTKPQAAAATETAAAAAGREGRDGGLRQPRRRGPTRLRPPPRPRPRPPPPPLIGPKLNAWARFRPIAPLPFCSGSSPAIGPAGSWSLNYRHRPLSSGATIGGTVPRPDADWKTGSWGPSSLASKFR